MNSSTASAVIDLKDVTKTYASGELSVQALRGITFSIQPGEYVAIMGPSGSGKSTLMNLLGALDRPTTGTYKLDGIDVATLNDNELAKIRLKKLGFIFQGFNLLARTSAIKNVALPLFYAGLSPRARNDAAIQRLKEVGLGDRLTHKPNELSGGQQQRVAIARALVNDPPSFSPTNQPVISIRKLAKKSWAFSSRSMPQAARSSWSRTMKTLHITQSESFAFATAWSSPTTLRRPQPSKNS